MAVHEVCVAPLPAWVDLARLLGPSSGQPWRVEALDEGWCEARASLSSEAAAELAARLRGVGLGGRAIACSIEPPLRRAIVRRARTEDARRRRETTPGFERPGVRLDEEGRWSLTPERLALRIARTADRAPIVDAGCGLGGNAIAFARAGCRVTAIEADPVRLAHARHNAKIYQVDDRIRFVLGDALALAREHAERDAILYVDPPWGREWKRDRCELAKLPLLAALLSVAGPSYAALWAKVPPSFAIDELPNASPEAHFGEAEGDRRRVKFLLLRAEQKSSKR
ncbi:MAG: class I SAM-dependent methyltransferase [Enhygromyxa sp.]